MVSTPLLVTMLCPPAHFSHFLYGKQYVSGSVWEGRQALAPVELRLRHHCRRSANLTAQALLSDQRRAD